jgi:hypothetical protein
MFSRIQKSSSVRVFAYLFAIVLLWMTQTPFARAQQDQGAIIGTVTDPTGAAVPNATVEVKDVNTGFTMTRQSNGSGNFSLSPLKIGTYELKISAAGFETALRSGIDVHAQDRLGIDMKLQLGPTTATVTVTEQEAQLQTQDASVGQTVTAGTIQDTPLNGRNYVYIAQLTMGVAPANGGARGAARGDFSANGQRAEQNNFILDGVDNNVNLSDFLNGASYVIKPPPDALSEFNLQTSNYSAELGHDAGGVLNASVKSGTNVVHGSVWEYFRNDKLNATDWFSLYKPEYRQNQFGGTLGGPVIKNKLFLFADAEANRVVYQQTGNFYSVPTALMQSSGFTNYTELLNTQLTGKGAPQYLYQRGGPATPGSTTSNVYACNGVQNTLCPNQVNPIAASILKLYPLPNYGGGRTYSNYLFQGKVTDNTTQYDVRSDWNISTKDQTFARYSYSQEPQHYLSPLGPILDGGPFDADGSVSTEGRNFTLSETHVFSPKWVNEARFGYNWIHASFLQQNNGTNQSATFGLGGIPYGPGNGGLPYFNISGLSAAGSPRYSPSQEYENVAQLLDNITTTVGNQTLKFGVALQRIRYSTLQSGQPRGNEVYNGMYSDDPAHSGTTGAGIVDFVTDSLQSATINNLFTTENQPWYNSVFVQDDWKVTHKLTLNLGLRWEYAQPYVEIHGRQGNFVPENYTPAGTATAPNYVIGGGEYLLPYKAASYALAPAFLADLAKNNITVRYTNNNSLVNSQYMNFAPRFGFAYSATDKIVVRGGYGIFYGGLENLGFGPNIGQNFPFAIADTIPAQTCSSPTNCTAPLINLETGFGAYLQNGSLSPTSLIDPSIQSYGISNKTPYTESYNLSVQYSISPTLSATVAYVGNVDIHLRNSNGSTNTYDGVLAPGVSTNPYTPLGGQGGTPGSGANYTAFGLSNGRLVTDNGVANYNSLQSKLEKRTSKNLSFLATYTYSHALDDARPPLGSYSGQGAYRLPQWLGIHYDYGTDLSDVRHRATFNGHYVLPVGHGQRFLNQAGVLNEVLGGWETSLTFRVQTGSPVDLVSNNTLGNGTSYPLRTGNPFAPGGTVQNTGLQCATATKTVQHWFNPCAFANPVSVTATNYNTLPLSAFYGPYGSTTVVGPGYNRVDMTLFKNFALLHESNLQFRADVFNLLNTPAHGQPATSVGGGGGAITNQTQTGSFGQITNERFSGEQPDARVIQLALKLSF